MQILPKHPGSLRIQQPVPIAPVLTIQLVPANYENTVFTTFDYIILYCDFLYYNSSILPISSISYIYTLLHTLLTTFVTFRTLPPLPYNFYLPCEPRFHALPPTSKISVITPRSLCCNAENRNYYYAIDDPHQTSYIRYTFRAWPGD